MLQYQSIYRKWRPQFFEDIIGQEHITRTLRNAIKRNRIAHAYIFSGPRGVGKTTTARILAKALNCQEGPTDHPCNKCSKCLRINQGQSMDVIEIDGASNRGIDEIRELRSKIGFAPAEGKYKVYIIDEVHMLTNEAFNALLKTLEEPPRQVLFIFATTAPQKIPKTILSRCQCFHFRAIPVEEIVLKLKKITEEEKLNIDMLSLRLIAESATGSLRDAESILDQVVTFSGEEIIYENVKEILGIIPQKLFLQLIEAIISKNIKKGLELIDELVIEGIDFHQFVQDMIVFIHQLLLVKILGKENDYRFPSILDESNEDILRLINEINTDFLLNIIERLNLIVEKIRYHQYPWILMELLIIKMTYTGKKEQQQKRNAPGIFEKIESKEKENISRLKVTEIKKEKEDYLKTEAEQKQKGNMVCQFNELWPKVLSRIKNERISLYAFLMASSNVYLQENKLMVAFHQDCLFHKESLEKRENREVVEAILKEESSNEIKLQCFIDENNSKGPNSTGAIGIDKDSQEIGMKQLENYGLDKQKGKNDLSDSKKVSTPEILEKARDLFGGNISEE